MIFLPTQGEYPFGADFFGALENAKIGKCASVAKSFLLSASFFGVLHRMQIFLSLGDRYKRNSWKISPLISFGGVLHKMF